jgi:hydroxymethylpyrimidine pyrophosphatase-like HAD family hydrolase
MGLINLRDADRARLQAVRLVATDMDGTLTVGEKFTPELLVAFDRLAQAGIAVVIVTGRSAGWVSAIAHYLPVLGAICENGGIFYRGEAMRWLVPMSDMDQHRRDLAMMFEQLRQRFPAIREASDNQFRLTDWTFDVAGLSRADLGQMDGLCRSAGWGFTYSTVQCHIKLPAQEKANGLQQVMQAEFPGLSAAQVVTVGDSPNDVSLFDRSVFPLSVGVANVANYLDQMAHQPLWITAGVGGVGFCELVDCLLGGAGLDD